MEGRKTLVADNFDVPEQLEMSRFTLRMLSISDLNMDYDAVMSSVDHLRNTYSVISGSDWPLGLTREDNRIDLGWHQREFTLRYSFAYTVVTPANDQCLGCVYLDPSPKPGYDVMVSLWVRASELSTGLDLELYGAVRNWILNHWPFHRVAYPAREIPLELWFRLPSHV